MKDISLHAALHNSIITAKQYNWNLRTYFCNVTNVIDHKEETRV